MMIQTLKYKVDKNFVYHLTHMVLNQFTVCQ